MASLAQDAAPPGLVGTYKSTLQLQVSDLVSSIDTLLKISDTDTKAPEPQLYNAADDTSSTGDPSSCSGEQAKGAEVSEPELELEPEAIDQSEPQPRADAKEKKTKPVGNAASKRSRKRLSLIDLAEKQRRQQEQRGFGTYSEKPPLAQQTNNFGYQQGEFGTQSVFCVWCGARCVPNCKFCMYCGSQATMSV